MEKKVNGNKRLKEINEKRSWGECEEKNKVKQEK